MSDILWELSEQDKNNTLMSEFAQKMKDRHFEGLSEYQHLYRWSIEEPEKFWEEFAEFAAIKWRRRHKQSYVPPPPGFMRGGQWFVGSQLNFAENLLPPASDRQLIASYAEGSATRMLTAKDLHQQVAQCADALRKSGVQKGDRIAAVMANVPETIVAMLATSSIGAIWSSCSPDFGSSSVLDRFRQIEPKVLFYTERYQYGGKEIACSSNIKEVLPELPSVKLSVSVDHLGGDTSDLSSSTSWKNFLELSDLDPQKPAVIDFEPMDFNDPLYIMFSSGTTGVPKCIVHSVGGTLLQHKKELMLHCDLRSYDRLLYFTTCGWMMWNWMASVLSTGANLALYEGSVVYPEFGNLWAFVEEAGVTHFGTSPKYIATCMQQKYRPQDHHSLHRLRVILSTGAPLLPEHFDWVYENVKSDVHLASISGGTDIISCFMLGNPLLPVKRGEIQSPGLGMAIESWDQDGKPARNIKGELVCVQPFPSMPIRFWNDPEGEKYKNAYFNYFLSDREVWRHGDFVSMSEDGGVTVFGRSDATLNPGGVRIGTAELYRVIESMPEVRDSIVVGFQEHREEVILLLLELNEQVELNEKLQARIRAEIREELSPRHVPRFIEQVKAIPYTRSGKKVELAVSSALYGEEVKNTSALSNPESLAEYYEIGRKLRGE